MTDTLPDLRVDLLAPSRSVSAQLAEILIETVAAGGSVGFMHPVTLDDALTFWNKALEAAQRGERLVLGAWSGPRLLGTVSVLLDTPVNQPHRAEIAKMMTRPDARGRGAATALLRRAETLAAERGRTLLILDTASDGGASRLYERLGYTFAGELPDYALKPHGGLTGTRLYYKRLALT
ncbi:GNAT family N-acetyltransferase [Deinococcus yavapaiensis]|uniref:Acetyltransferase (GNAT) family protein n=1 Tax=Deinococcus yavapaiensis KR-236 TaxID=694435 RepID=A0A318SBQ3_9DEIO|nr:GNAT family N-acetyltransferase [Deinococcus yavapaiensis]PYE54631.1 acetyltransferase (GNAT) family protein [Deinococcus yavapaiensis KR-236]